MISDPQRWIWDSWYAKDGDDHHAFFLAAPRSLGDPDLRHWNAVAAHAVSRDLRDWQHLPDALVPGDAGRFDDQAIWTGSVVKDGDLWRMFYTGIDVMTRGARQRVGQATSHDLVTWTRVSPDPIAMADPRWYSTFDRDGVEAFRDPWVFQHTDGRWHMLVTATDLFGHGCIGHATSDDLLTWVVEEPLAIKTGFLQLEVLQIHTYGDTPVLFFSCLDTDISVEGVERRTGYYSAPAESALGPFALDRAEPVGPEGLYAGRVIETTGGPVMLGFRNVTASQPFEGVIDEPVPLTLTPRGTAIATQR